MIFSIKDTQDNKSAECRDFLIVLFNVVMLSVIVLSVIVRSVIVPSVIALSVFMLSVVMLNVAAPWETIEDQEKSYKNITDL